MSWLDEVLCSMEQDKRIPLLMSEGDFTYSLQKENGRSWIIRKLDGSRLAAEYGLRLIRDKWYCNCPAGRRGRDCKHAAWISVIEQLQRKTGNGRSRIGTPGK